MELVTQLIDTMLDLPPPDTVPELQYTFIEQALRPGPPVSLRCSATGSPPPSFTWLLDGEPLSEIASGHRCISRSLTDQYSVS